MIAKPNTMEEALSEIARLNKLIADAFIARGEGRAGDAWRILKTGIANPLLPATGVIARDGGGA